MSGAVVPYTDGGGSSQHQLQNLNVGAGSMMISGTKIQGERVVNADGSSRTTFSGDLTAGIGDPVRNTGMSITTLVLGIIMGSVLTLTSAELFIRSRQPFVSQGSYSLSLMNGWPPEAVKEAVDNANDRVLTLEADRERLKADRKDLQDDRNAYGKSKKAEGEALEAEKQSVQNQRQTLADERSTFDKHKEQLEKAAGEKALVPIRALFEARPVDFGGQTTLVRMQSEMDKEKLRLERERESCREAHKEYSSDIFCNVEKERIKMLQKCQQEVVSPATEAVERDVSSLINEFYSAMHNLLFPEKKD